MQESIERKFEERRSYLAHILNYLDTGILNKNINQNDVITYLDRLIKRMYAFEEGEEDLSREFLPTVSFNFEEDLDNYLKSSNLKHQNESQSDLKKLLNTELSIFKSNQTRGKFLQFCYDKMINIKISPVDIERVFSSCSLIVTKFRTHLSDSNIDSYLFLKHYFRNLEAYKKDFPDLDL